ncbi:hypothetical protein LJ739_11550 [Aestuariibacter halophilus]|uniref:Uncharacterized protein n=1 Tax=Fluctibacter halophilus TaxID=226011 RepID=A0ABS8G8W1_9ALTE|nr:hypothetical protein [Aestuariibacter halophilus]MCC2616878.1 hypothetical protein [Aestuariibacter halophilus]
MCSRWLGVFLILVLLSPGSFAQTDNNSSTTPAVATTTQQAKAGNNADSASGPQLHLSDAAAASWAESLADASEIITLIFILAVIALVAATILVKYTEYSWTPYSVIRLLGLILILMITLILTVVPSIEQETLTQVIGLLGAIGGYLLGKDPREMDINRTEKAKPKPEKPTAIGEPAKIPFEQ